MKTVFRSFPLNRILNMDESAWNYAFMRGQVLAFKNKEEVDAKLPVDYRSSFTVIATITADGGRLPPVFLAKGSTIVCEQQFKEMTSDDNEYYLDHAPAGNTTEEVMIRYLKLVNKLMKNQNCALVLDQYPAHMTENVKAEANKLHIKLVFIPTSATDMFQPLDKRVFGALKSMAAAEFSNYIFTNGDAYTKSQAADLFIKCWKKLGIGVIKAGWKYIHTAEEEEEEEEEEGKEESTDEDFKEHSSDSNDASCIDRSESRALIDSLFKDKPHDPLEY